ncbi:MAG: hypothetical protein M1820_000311 [Bogoriella megaspora]|nr:MAG: hypothetical protein M1820_000311 [Bogoriella megaspora]
MLCITCANLKLSHQDFELPASIPIERLGKTVLTGTLSELKAKSSACQLCCLILRALQLNQQRNPQSLQDGAEWELTRSSSTVEYSRTSRKTNLGSAFYPMLKAPLAGRFYGIQLIDDKHTGSLLRGRLVDEGADVAQIQGWIRRCQSEHEKSCQETYLKIPECKYRLYFIDVESKCLVDSTADTTYTALSYVWGDTNKILTTISNMKSFRERDAFTKISLPRTIEDAIAVTSALGYRYLWIDSLCIVQDDDKFKRLMIDSMASIYGNAIITLVAATGGHADAGLSGWIKTTRKAPMEDVEKLPDGLQIGLRSFFEGEIEDSPWSRRGWTYQEEVLSSRCLVFMQGRIFFYCRTALWREDLMAESSEVQSIVKSSTRTSLQSAEPLARFSDHVEMYTSRKLTHLSDIDRAFSGIRSGLELYMNLCEFLHGLPTAAFDWALLWGSFVGHHVERRPSFPSWSWMGHIGRTLMVSRSASSRAQQWLREKTWIDWYYIKDGNARLVWPPPTTMQTPPDTQDPSHEIAIYVSEMEVKAQKPTEPFSDYFPKYGTGSPGNLYGRENGYLPNFGPMAPLNQNLAHITPIQNDILDFTTFSCRFYLSQPLKPNAREVYTSNCFVLKDSQLEVCGICHDDHNLFGSGWAFEGKSCEALLLSYTSGQSRDRAIYRFEDLGIPEKYQSLGSEKEADGDLIVLDDEGELQWESWDMLNVMLVRPHSQDSSVHERVAVGVVHKAAVENSLEPVRYKRTLLG